MKKAAVFFVMLLVLVVCGSIGTAQEIDGKILYQPCAGCHGETGETMALGSSAKLKGQTADQILKKLNGYADGTYGGSKKNIMTSIIKRMSEEARVKVSEYISTF
ncbi:c-type cytochrome [Halodesulfovibrio spirochaetisodalis]|uniref:Cytochrome c domain-containing protein n=1 Tax=Halodesulfovibrio spirochaetisodalis TaxID=1560234 RepID=A0A1B7XB88_9BACT|nr:c-type cytochrome [Halodesulfovibrio spirochaetisodalis]OBQ46648.1 hypothetical protein SP90_10980 [Halodesulfovibrio spirochaetisodalis]